MNISAVKEGGRLSGVRVYEHVQHHQHFRPLPCGRGAPASRPLLLLRHFTFAACSPAS
jgi:hypothetical protein